MATLARLQGRASVIESQYYFRNGIVDKFRKRENDAAVKIQSWFRGCQVRAYIRHLNKIVTIIQKWWRGYIGRKQYQLLVKLLYGVMLTFRAGGVILSPCVTQILNDPGNYQAITRAKLFRI